MTVVPDVNRLLFYGRTNSNTLFILLLIKNPSRAKSNRTSSPINKKRNQPLLAGSFFNFHGERGGIRTRDL